MSIQIQVPVRANFLDLLSAIDVSKVCSVLCCLAFQMFTATIFGVRASTHLGFLAKPDMRGLPSGEIEVAPVVGLSASLKLTRNAFHLMACVLMMALK